MNHVGECDEHYPEVPPVSDEEVKDSISYGEVLGFFSEAAKMHTYQPGEYVIQQGDLMNDVVYIKSGEVEVVTLSEMDTLTSSTENADDSVGSSMIDAPDDIILAAMMNKVNKVEHNHDCGRNDSAKGGSGSGRGWGRSLSCCFGGGEGEMRRTTSTSAFITTRGAGEFIGETSQGLGPSRQSASVRAIVETRCFHIPLIDLMETLQEEPEIMEEIRLSTVRYGLHCLEMYPFNALDSKALFPFAVIGIDELPKHVTTIDIVQPHLTCKSE